MDINTIREWLERFEKEGIRLSFTDAILHKDKEGNLKGRPLGVIFDSIEHDTRIVTQVYKEGKKIKEIEVDSNGKFREV
jgi:hypothetical protein